MPDTRAQLRSHAEGTESLDVLLCYIVTVGEFVAGPIGTTLAEFGDGI